MLALVDLPKPYFLYILKCSDGSLYTGITEDVQRRMQVHASGKGSKYVHSRWPAEVVYTEQVETKSAALRREIEIKKLTRDQKLALIAGFGLGVDLI